MRFDIILIEACSIFLPLWYLFVHKSWGWVSFNALKIYSTYKQNYMYNPSIHHLSLFFFSTLWIVKFHSPSFTVALLSIDSLLVALSSLVFASSIKSQFNLHFSKMVLLTCRSSQVPRILPCFLTSYKHIFTPKVSPYAFPQLSILDFSHNSQKL